MYRRVEEKNALNFFGLTGMFRAGLLGAGLALVGVSGAGAQTLEETLALAYTNNPDIRAARANLRVLDEGVPQAKAGWRPTVTSSISAGGSYTDTQTSNTSTNSGSIPRANRVGWAFIADDALHAVWGQYDHCGEVFASVLRSEFRAVVELFRITIGPITVHVNNKAVVDGVQNGCGWCCDARREADHFWRQLWDRSEDLRGLVRVVKVKAHGLATTS